jgi:hypothetical protein
MKYKFLLTLSILSTAIVLSACGSDTSDDSEKNTEIVSATETESTETTDTETVSDYSLTWVALGELENYPELRASLESSLSITTNDSNEKEGILYKNPDTLETDQNTTLLLNLRNQDYATYFINGDTSAFTSAAETSFSDIDDDSALAAAINAYYNLLPDETEGVFNGDATLTRAQAMALVMRATTPVTESGEPESNEAFTSAVGYTTYTDYAAAMDSLAYLSVTNGTLNTDNFTTAMTEGEFTYLVIKTIVNDYESYLKDHEDQLGFADGLDGYMSDFNDTSSVTLSTIKDAGDISLTDAIANPDNGVPTDMYNTFKLGIKLGLITESDIEDWDTAITKTDAVTTLLNATANFMNTSYSVTTKYIITSDTTDTLTTARKHNEAVASGEFTDTYEDTRPVSEVTAETSATTAICEEYGSMKNWGNIARENGADGVRGYYWYYEHESAAGDKGSYLVYMREGSPYYGQVFQYGDTLLDGTINQYGTNDEYYASLNKESAESWAEAGFDVEYNDDGTFNVIINTDDLNLNK